jgi:hypothetical protein
MKREFLAAIKEAEERLDTIEKRVNEMDGYADDLVDMTKDRLDDAFRYYDDTYAHLYLDDFAYNDIDDII